jgi:hypothetical protein
MAANSAKRSNETGTDVFEHWGIADDPDGAGSLRAKRPCRADVSAKDQFGLRLRGVPVQEFQG